ncbi:MAG: diacylglycerol kinase family protein [Hyphomonadaceae bacterium]|nr:diacylglycerol kinase family protein [Hyphomonadaceae bacterium]
MLAVVNSTAGGVGPDGRQHLRQALAALGHTSAEVVEFDRENGARQLLRMCEQPRTRVIVWGGDGTHRTALNAIGRESDNLLLLPGGTMNLLTKWIHGNRPWRSILETVLVAGRTRTLPAGRVNGGLFFCALLAGAPALLAGARESLRIGDLGHAFADISAASNSTRALHLVSRTVQPGVDTGADRTVGNVVGAFVGPLSRSGHLEVSTLAVPSLVSAVDAAWSSFGPGSRDLADTRVRIRQSLVIEAGEGEDIPVIMDGERVAVGDRFRIDFVQNAARCLAV